MNRQSTAWKKLMVLLVLPVLTAFMFAGSSHAATAAASSVWSKTLTNSSDSTFSIYKALPLSKTAGYLTVGGAYSMDDSSAWVMKLDADGNIDSGYTYSGITIDKIHEVTDGFIAVGYSSSGSGPGTCDPMTDPDCTEYPGTCDPMTDPDCAEYPGTCDPMTDPDCAEYPGICDPMTDPDCPEQPLFKPRKSYGLGTTIVLKLGVSGDLVWQRELLSDTGGSIEINDIKETATNKYSLSGTLYTTDNAAKILLIAIDGTDESNPVLTTKVTAVAVADDVDIAVETSAVKFTKDGFIATGVVSDTSGATDATFIAALKVSAAGVLEWAIKYSLPIEDGSSLKFNTIAPTKDGYIATGQTTPADGSEDKNWLAKLNTTGAITWVKTLKMVDTESTATVLTHGIREDTDGGYITSALVDDMDAGTFTTVIVKLDSNGVVKWQKVAGSDSGQYFMEDIRPLKTGGYFVGGVLSSDEDYTSSPWFAKLDNTGATRCTSLTSEKILKTEDAGFPDEASIKNNVTLADDELETITDVDSEDYEGVSVDTLTDDGSCTQTTITVDITSVNNGAGSVKSVPVGINCKSTDESCTSEPLFWPGSTVTLTATAVKGSMFDGWYDSDGIYLTATGKYVMTVGTDNTITAKFSKPVTVTGSAKDVKGKGISGATVSIAKDTGEVDDNGDPVYTTPPVTAKTNSKGLFTLQVSPGVDGEIVSYLVTISKTGYSFSPSEQIVDVGDADVELDEPFVGHVYSLSGKVTRSNSNGDEVAAPKVTVKLVIDTGNVDDNGDPIYEDTKFTAKTNSKGIYVFKKVTAGDYTILASIGTGASLYMGETYVSADDFDYADDKDIVGDMDIYIEPVEM